MNCASPIPESDRQQSLVSSRQLHGRMRVLAILGVVLAGINLRPAVTALPPLYGFINDSFPVSFRAQSVLGMLPTLTFAAMGLFTPWLSRRLGVIRGMLLGMALLTLGSLGRAFLATTPIDLGLFSLLAFTGIGIGNVLLPSVVKDFFPRQLGGMTSVYSLLDTLGAAAPSYLGVILAEFTGWHFALAIWGLLAALALVPWFFLLPTERRTLATARHDRKYSAWKWPVTWAITGVFAGGVASMYAFIAWLPDILVQTAGMAPEHADEMLALFSLMGLIHCAIAPRLIVSWQHNVVVVLFGALCIMTGALGLAYLPQLGWLWVIPAGLGAMNIPIGLTLVTIRSRSEEGSTALSAFMQGVGYLLGSLGPLVTGYLFSVTGSWRAPLGFIALLGVGVALCGVVACRREQIEDSHA